MSSICGRNDEESWIILWRSTVDTYILSVRNIKFIVFVFFTRCSISLSIRRLKIQSNCERFFTINSSQVSINIPLCFFSIAIGQLLSVWSQHLTIFINSFFTWICLYNESFPFFFLLISQNVWFLVTTSLEFYLFLDENLFLFFLSSKSLILHINITDEKHQSAFFLVNFVTSQYI